MAQISGFRNQRKMLQSDKSLSIPNTPNTKFKINDTEIVLHDILPENTSSATFAPSTKRNPHSSSKLEYTEGRKRLREKKKADAIERRENKIRLRILKKEELASLKQQRKRARKLKSTSRFSPSTSITGTKENVDLNLNLSEKTEELEFSALNVLNLNDNDEINNNNNNCVIEVKSEKENRNNKQKSIIRNRQLKSPSFNCIGNSINIIWTPIQRLIQLNQGLSFTEMYKDSLYWDRITTEFFLPTSHLKLQMGSDQSSLYFNIPFRVISKFFWVWALSGLERLQFFHAKITENLVCDSNSSGNSDGDDGIKFSSSEAFLYSYLKNGQVMINHRTVQVIDFDSRSRISNWAIQIETHNQFWQQATIINLIEPPKSVGNDQLLSWGFPKKVIEFLEVALVMESLLPDLGSWMTWFCSYINQNGLKNFAVLDSHPTIPELPISMSAVNSDDLMINDLEFYDKERDYIFNILNSAASQSNQFQQLDETNLRELESESEYSQSDYTCNSSSVSSDCLDFDDDDDDENENNAEINDSKLNLEFICYDNVPTTSFILTNGPETEKETIPLLFSKIAVNLSVQPDDKSEGVIIEIDSDNDDFFENYN